MPDRPRILIVEGRYYEEVADHLAAGAIQVLDKAGVAYDRLRVPGAFEIPAAIGFAVRSMAEGTSAVRYHGFIALGCVLRGETTHYDYVCTQSSRALMDLSLAHSLALGFGILTCENLEQAMARARVEDKNKGGEVAHACLRMLEVKNDFHLDRP